MSRLVILLCLPLLLLPGCGSPAAATPHSDPTSLRWGLAGVPDVPTLDPALASDPTSISVASLVYGGLVRLDNRLRVQPDGAKSWTISDNGTVYTFHLRRNLRFPDGRRVTAADFVAALQRALGPEGSSGTAPFYLSLIAYPSEKIRKGVVVQGIQALGPETVRIVLRHPAGYFLAELAFPASFVPDPAALQRYGQTWTNHAAGFGPYSVENWQHGRSLTLIRNSHYYGGLPAFRRIVLHFYTDTPSALQDYKKHGLDLVSGLQPGSTLSGQITGLTRVPALALDYLAFNTTRFPFHHLNARRAFSTINPAKIATRVMGAAAFPVAGFAPGVAGSLWKPSKPATTYLRMAKYTTAHPMKTVSFAVLRDPRIYALAIALRVAWERKLGVTVVLHELNASNYGVVLNAHAFDLAIVRWGADYPDPQDFLGTQLGSSSDNVTGWTARRYEALLKRADALPPANPLRSALYGQAAAEAAQKLALVPLDVPAQTAVIAPNLHGVQITPLGTVTGEWTAAGFR